MIFFFFFFYIDSFFLIFIDLKMLFVTFYVSKFKVSKSIV